MSCWSFCRTRECLFRLQDLNQELEEALGRKVDLASKEGLKPRVRPYVMRDLRMVYEA